MNSSTPAFVISGTSSGSGKTTIALGLMAAFKEKGYEVQPFKCGPDFIDPGLHHLVTGTVSRNLDLWMTGEEFTRKTFDAHCSKADLAIVEGVMGMYDGGRSSSGTLAEFLDIPNILVLDVRSMAESAAAIVKGFETLTPSSSLAGVILNRIASPRHLELVTNAIGEHCKAQVLGYLPRTMEFSIPSRHLGLLTMDESPLHPEAIKLLGQSISQHIDLDKILESTKRQELVVAEKSDHTPESSFRIGIARDKAFCFYYEDNFDILRAAGAELVFFSPLEDTSLPDNLDFVYLGGGYPELYAEQLSNNKQMLLSLSKWIEDDHPVYCECGGFMYLTEGIVDAEEKFHTMVGAFPVKARMQKKRASLGYREIRIREASFLGEPGTVLRGHEFHYSYIDQMPDTISRLYSVDNGSREGYLYRKVVGGYIHLHFGYNPQVAEAMINYCRE